MAYGYFPVGYQPAQIYSQGYPQNYPPYQQQSTVPQYQTPQAVQNAGGNPNGSSITWVQGESAAKSFAVNPGQSVMLMDSESNVFYIKSMDASGMPLPLRIFDYKERVASAAPPVEQVPESEYITRKEFEERIAGLMHETGKMGTSEKEAIQVGEQSII